MLNPYALARFVERRFRAIVLITAAVAALLALPMSGLRMVNSFDGWIDKGDELYRTYEEFTRQFGSDDTLLLVFKTGDLLKDDTPNSGEIDIDNPFAETPKGPVWRYTEAVEQLRTLHGIIGMVDPVSLYVEENGFDPAIALALKDRALAQQKRAELQDKISGNWGPLVSKDLNSLGLLIQFDPELRQEHEQILAAVRTLFDQTEIPYRMAGVPYFSSVLAASLTRDLTLVISLLITIALIALALLLRSWRVVAAVSAGIAVGIVITLGIGALFGIQLTLMTLILFSLLFCVGLTTAVHLFSRRRNGVWELEYAYGRMLQPSLIAMVTTLVGCSSFLFAPQGIIRQLGLLLPLGIALTFASVLIFVPALFRWLSGARPLSAPAFQRLLSSNDRDGSVRRAISLILAVAAAVSLWLLPGIQTNPDAIFFFAQDSELVRDYRQIEDELTGLLAVELLVRSTQGESLLAPANRERIEGFLQQVDSMPGLTSRFSAYDLLAGDNPPPAAAVQRFLNDGQGLMRISLRFRNLSAQGFQQILDGLNNHWREGMSGQSGLSMEVTGQIPLILMAQERLLRIQGYVFAAVIVAISFLLLLFLRALWVLGPVLVANLLPLAVTCGAMALLDIQLNPINIFVASVLLGVIVDDTVHLLHAARANGSISRALQEVRPALWITSVTVALAFSALLVSRIVPLYQFGLLSVIAVVSAYLCDVYLLPTLLRRERL